MTLYYARPIEKISDCTKYDLFVEMQEQERKIYVIIQNKTRLDVCFFWKIILNIPSYAFHFYFIESYPDAEKSYDLIIDIL